MDLEHTPVSDTHDTTEEDPPRQDPSRQDPPRSSGAPWLVAAGVAVAAVMLFLAASQVYLVMTMNSTRDELASAREEIEVARTDVVLLEAEVTALGETIEEATTTTTATSEAPQLSNPAAPVGVLPPFVAGQPDQAVGMTLGAISGLDGYGEDTITIDAADGQKRVWMIWAHWCPYCQQELPVLTASYDEYLEKYPDISIATITTSIDPTRGNALDPYLEDNQFPFPVLVDTDSSLAAELGVSAFPFWVITDGDGTVLLRSAGYLEAAQVDSLLESLDAYG